MSYKFPATATFVFGMLITASILVAEEPRISSATIKASIEKGLPYVAKRGDWWIEKKDCVSCHRVAFTAWSHVEAQRAGIVVDAKQVNEWIDWCHDDLLSLVAEKDRKRPEEKKVERNYSGGAQVIALAKHWNSTERQIQKQAAIIDELMQGQEKDGKWSPKGQLPSQKRELVETSHVVTLWNALALGRVEKLKPSDQARMEKAVGAAKSFVDLYEDGKSSEWLALRAWFAEHCGDQANRDKYFEKLLSSQNQDGGWGWVAGEDSDVLASAQIVYVLIQLGHNSQSKPVQRAVAYLISQQKDDGSWKVKGTKKKAKNRFVETANYWGSAWSVIALSNCLASEPGTSK